MKITRVVGLGLAIIMLKFLVPEIFGVLENTFLMFFDTLQQILALSGDISTANFFDSITPAKPE